MVKVIEEFSRFLVKIVCILGGAKVFVYKFLVVVLVGEGLNFVLVE